MTLGIALAEVPTLVARRSRILGLLIGLYVASFWLIRSSLLMNHRKGRGRVDRGDERTEFPEPGAIEKGQLRIPGPAAGRPGSPRPPGRERTSDGSRTA
jgi:hypothetical protein